jgi:hypothetical protein
MAASNDMTSTLLDLAGLQGEEKKEEKTQRKQKTDDRKHIAPLVADA